MIFHLILITTLNILVVCSAPITGIPTREEQGNLLLNVQEIFDELKMLLQDETNGTETSILSDVEKVVKRAKYHLSLVEELAFMKLIQSEASNTINISDIKPEIVQLTKDGLHQLNECITTTKKLSNENTKNIKNATDAALNNGENLINSLYECSKKPALNLLTCYKSIITKEVHPVKKLMVSAIKAHKAGNIEYIKIREKVNQCVDNIVDEHETKVSSIFNNYITKSKPRN